MSTRVLLCLLLALLILGIVAVAVLGPLRQPGNEAAPSGRGGAETAERGRTVTGSVLVNEVSVERAEVELRSLGREQSKPCIVVAHRGHFEFDDVEPGTYMVLVSDARLGAASAATVVGPSAGAQVTLRLCPWATVGGVVVSQAGKPVDGATIRAIPLVYPCDTPIIWRPASVTSGRDGAFLLSGLPRGYCRLIVQGPSGGEAAFEPVRVPCVGLQLRVMHAGSARLRFVEMAGDVEIIGVPGHYLTRTRIDPGGEIVLRGLPLGLQPLLARTTSSHEEQILVEVTRDADAAPRDVRLRPGAPVRLLVQDQITGEAVPNVAVDLKRAARDAALIDLPTEIRVRADAAGSWSGRLSSGEWRATVDDPSVFPNAWAHAEFDVGTEPAAVIARVERAKALIGRVVYKDGVPASEATVTLAGDQVDDQVGVSGEGRFVVRCPLGSKGVSLVARDRFGNVSAARHVDLTGANDGVVELVLPAPTATVAGSVVDENGVATPFVLVQCAHLVTATDASGHFSIDRVPPGRLVLRLSRCEGFPRFHEVARVAPGQALDVGTLALAEDVTRIEGHALVSGEARAGTPVGAAVILPDDTRLDAATTTSADGSFEIAVPHARQVTTSCWLPGHSWDSSSTPVGDAAVRPELQIVRRTTALLMVRGAEATPHRVEIAVATESGFEDAQAHWDRIRGQALFTISPGHQRLRVLAPGHAPTILEATILPQNQNDLGKAHLRVGGRVVGRVVDASGKPIAGVVVWLGRDVLQTITENDGWFIFENAPPGTWSCDAYTSDAGYASDVEEDIRVVDGEEARLTLTPGE